MPNLNKLLVLSLFTISLASCAAGYHQSLFPGYTIGYQNKTIAPNIEEVSFLGNAANTPEQTYLYAMKRAAELTKERHYAYFAVLNTKNHIKTSVSYAGYVPITSTYPVSTLTIQFLSVKTTQAYDADRVLQQTNH